MELGDSPFGSTGVQWNFVSLHVLWNFRSFIEFHGTSQLGIGIPWNSMEFGYIVKFHGTLKISWIFSTGYSDSLELHGIWLCSQIQWKFLKFHGIPWNFCSESGDSMEFHGIPSNLVLASSSMELSKFHGIPWNLPFDLEKFHGIPRNVWRVPWNSMKLWNININKFHNWGSVFHCL